MPAKSKRLTPPGYYRVVKLGIALSEEGRQMSLQDITQYLNVGDRTAYRFIATLRNDFGAPIVLIRTQSGAFYTCSNSWSMIEALKHC